MKHLWTLLLCLPLCAVAQDIQQDSLTMEPDTSFMDSLTIVEAEMESLPIDTLEADSLIFHSTLSSLDEKPGPINPTAELTDSEYIARLQALPFVVEMPYNPVIKAFILRYVQRNPKQLSMLLAKSAYYFPIFEDVLGKQDLPYELCYLPVIESALNPNARSHMGAAGLWQFMPSTGKRYGLEINSLVDERLDPRRSTEAACLFLKDLYDGFQDWNLAIAAYNCGSGNVRKAMTRSGKTDFWSIYPFLPRETRAYLPIFIAAAYSMNYAKEYGIQLADLDINIDTDTVFTTHRMHLKQISEVLNIPIDDLRRLNPQYPRDIVAGGKAYAICLPSKKSPAFYAKFDKIIAYQADELINNRRSEIELLQKTSVNGAYSINGVTYYKVKSGDTLSGIASKFHCSVKQLKAWNGLKSDMIHVGKTLKLLGR